MMHQILNTLYVMSQGAYVHLDHETLRVEREGKTQLQVPLHHLSGVFCFGDVMPSPALMHRCAEDGRAFVLMDRNGKFKARLEGPVSGNVLLRRTQHLALSDDARPVAIARNIVAGKIQNARQVVLRGGREAVDAEDASRLETTARWLAGSLSRLEAAMGLDEIRGWRGMRRAVTSVSLIGWSGKTGKHFG